MQLSTITFKREDTGETFKFGPHPPYMLHPNTKLPTPGALSVSGVENFGADGGMTLASRLQRQPVKIVYNVMEDYKHERGMLDLITQASAFFQVHNLDDLSVIRYSMIVQTSDSKDEAYMMEHGAITVPFSAPLVRGYGLSVASEMDFIFDDPTRYWVSGAGLVSATIMPYLPPTLIGERWTNGFQTWIRGSQWDSPTGGDGDKPATLNVVTAVPVGMEIDIYGFLNNPRITNLTNGSYWQYTASIAEGGSIHVSSDGTARDSDGTITYKTLGTLTAQPGVNQFVLTSIYAAGGYAKIKIRGAF